MRYQLLIFDWDGTLADSAAQIVDSMQAAILALGLPPRGDGAIRELIGLGLPDAMQRLYPELETGQLLRLLDAYRRRFVGQTMREMPLFEGALTALERLHARGYRLAVATGKSRAGLRRAFAHHAGLARLIAASRCADETASKPHPMMLEELLLDEGLSAADALMIGDTEYDMAMARAAGMDGVGVACGVHEPRRILGAGALGMLRNVSELPDWLERP